MFVLATCVPGVATVAVFVIAAVAYNFLSAVVVTVVVVAATVVLSL